MSGLSETETPMAVDVSVWDEGIGTPPASRSRSARLPRTQSPRKAALRRYSTAVREMRFARVRWGLDDRVRVHKHRSPTLEGSVQRSITCSTRWTANSSSRPSIGNSTSAAARRTDTWPPSTAAASASANGPGEQFRRISRARFAVIVSQRRLGDCPRLRLVNRRRATRRHRNADEVTHRSSATRFNCAIRPSMSNCAQPSYDSNAGNPVPVRWSGWTVGVPEATVVMRDVHGFDGLRCWKEVDEVLRERGTLPYGWMSR